MINFPNDVEGWLTQIEGRKLAALAHGKAVLEIGSYKGRSTICMAQTAERLASVDWHGGDPGAGFGSTEVEFRANLEKHGFTDKVQVNVCRSVDFTTDERFDLVFIDGAHDYQSVKADIRVAMEFLKPGGLLAFHDYRTFIGEYDGGWDEGVTNAVDQMLAGGATLIERCGSLAVVDPSGKSKALAKPNVFIGMPRYNETAVLGATKAYLCPSRGACEMVGSTSPRTSLLDHCFNLIWADALDKRDQFGATHFAMIHSDVEPPMGWLDDLYEELVANSADIVSAVIPIKNSCGLTSTAINPNDCFAEYGSWVPRRLTMHEVAQLPETFGARDVGCPMLLNTGLWICDLRREWVNRVCFDSAKRIVIGSDKKRVAQCISEDWFFSNALNQMGYSDKLYATRKVKVLHHGEREFKNWDSWGLWKTDETYEAATGQPNATIGETQCVSSS